MTKDDEIHKGGTCLNCGAVVFTVGDMIHHTYETRHRWYKSGMGAVIKLNLYLPPVEMYQEGYKDGYEDCKRNEGGEDDE